MLRFPNSLAIKQPFLLLSQLSASLRLESYDLVNEKEKYKSIASEMDQTFAELAGY
jgi:hypothetical protein